MKNLTFKAAMLNDSRTTVNRQSTDGQSQRHYKQTPLSKRWKVLMTLVFLFTFAIGQVWANSSVSHTFSSSDVFTDSKITVNSDVYLTKRASHTSSLFNGNNFYIGSNDNYICVNVAEGYAIDSIKVTTYTAGSEVASGKAFSYGESTSDFSTSEKASKFTYKTKIAFGNASKVTGSGNLLGTAKVIPTISNCKSLVIGRKIGGTGDGTTFAVGKIEVFYTTSGGGGGGDPTPAAGTYTVKYKDGTTELYSESIEVGSHPAGITDPKKDCYEFAGWKNGTADVADVTTLSGEKDEVITLQAQWTPLYVPQGSDYVFVNNAEVGTAPNKLTMTNGTTVNVTAGSRIDNIFFGAMAIKYESGATLSSGDDFKGWKINTNSATIKFLVENDSRVTITVGNLTSGCNIAYTNTSNTAQNVALAAKTANGYDVKGGTMVTLTTQGNKTVTLKGIAVSEVPALSDDATLSDLKVNGTTVAGFASGTQIYRTSVAYGTAVADMPKITGATPTDTNATVSDVQETFYDSDHGYYVSQVKVTAQNGTDYKFYQLRITVEPKLGVELIKALTSTDLTDGVGTATGYIGGKYYTNNGKGATKKLDSNKNYGLELKGDNTFDEGDLFVMNITTAAGATMGTMKLYESATATDNLYESTNIGTVGLNAWALTDAVDAKNSLFIKRGSGNDWNPTFSSIAVYRLMPAFIDSFSIEGVEDFVIDQDLKTITASVANTFDVTSLTPTIKYWGNGGGAIDKTGAQNFTNPVTYTVSSAYAEDATGAYAPVTYTVTITKVVPSATPNITTDPASANYYEGATIAALSVEASVTDGGNLTYQWYLGADAIDGATDATYAPDVTEIGSYSYKCEVTNKKGDKPAASVMSSVATIVIAEDPATIKLFSNTGVLNTNDFISPEATTIEIQNIEYPCLTQFSSNRTSLGGASPSDMVQYNATTDKAMIKMTFYNNNSSVKKAILYKYEEGAESPEKIEIEVPGQTIYTTDFYKFNSSKNRSFYVCMNDRSNIRVLQVKVIDNGANPVKQFGQVGYSLKLNKGRLYAKDGVQKTFEGWTLTTSSEYKVYNNSNFATKAANEFSIATPAIMHVERSGGKYYVYQDPADKGTLYSANADIELNTTGTWYISSETTSSATSFTLIRFDAPKCEKPVFNALTNSEICAGDAYVALDGTGTVNDGGTITYKWYAEGGTDVLGTEATYTPTADGSYYVVATNSLVDHTDNVATSDVVTVTTFASAAITAAPQDQHKVPGQNATLTVTATGKAPLSYQWYTCDENGDNAVAVEGATAASYEVEVTAGMNQYFKVVVNSACGSAEAVALVAEWSDYELADVTGSMTWNWKVSENAVWDGLDNIDIASTMVMANAGQGAMPNNSDFRSDMLKAVVSDVQTRVRPGQDGGCFQGNEIMFHTTVPGKVTVTYRGTGNNANVTLIIGSETLPTYHGGFTTSKEVIVPAGDVVISSGSDAMRVQKIVFDATPDHERDVVIGNMGTVCLPNPSRAFGVNVYELAGKGEGCKVNFDLLAADEVLEAGKAYVLVMTDTKAKFFYTNTENPATVADSETAMKGNLAADPIVFQPNSDKAQNVVFFKDNSMWSAATTGLKVGQYRAYLQYDEVGATTSAPAPGRRRISLDLQGQNAATGMDELNASDAPVKVLIDGQIYILRGEKMFDTTGRLVK